VVGRDYDRLGRIKEPQGADSQNGGYRQCTKLARGEEEGVALHHECRLYLIIEVERQIRE
jgi:hypothetical protein